MILNIVEEENQGEPRVAPAAPVTLINDCCLAFSVLVYNDGEGGRPSMRLLDMSTGFSTPVLILDAHKHIGSDRHSTVVGTRDALCTEGQDKGGSAGRFCMQISSARIPKMICFCPCKCRKIRHNV